MNKQNYKWQDKESSKIVKARDIKKAVKKFLAVYNIIVDRENIKKL